MKNPDFALRLGTKGKTLNPKLDICHEVHQKEYGTFPTVTASAPGKVGLLGDYTEFAQGLGLGAALDLRLFITLSPRPDGLVRFYSREYNERKKAVPGALKFRKEDRWANYPKGVLAGFAALGVKIEGLDVAITSEIPQGIGLASSQALCLAAALAFNEYYHTGLGLSQLLPLAHKAEQVFLGLPSDLAPFLYQAYCKEGSLLMVDFRSLETQRLSFPANWGELAIINTKVPASSFDSSARKAREECELCIRQLDSGRTGRSLRDFNRGDLRERVGTIPESARRRSLHVVDEITRTLEAKEVWSDGDRVSMGRLMHRSHESLRDLYEVSCPEIDWLVKRLQECEGVIGAKMTGEDSGGCVVVVAQPEAWERFRSQTDEYERIFGFKAEVLTFQPSAGAMVHQLVQSSMPR